MNRLRHPNDHAMEHVYTYRFDRRTLYWTALHLFLLALLGAALYLLYEGGYLSAWFTSFMAAVVALMALSIPRRIVVTNQTVQIRCLLDITELRRDEIASVRRVPRGGMKGFVPLFGGCGFFGYYGHYLDLKRFDRVRIYASEWHNMVEITDIYEERLYVSCSEPDRLVAQLTPVPEHRRTGKEIAEGTPPQQADASHTDPPRIPTGQ